WNGAWDRGVHPFPRSRARALGKLSALYPALTDRVCAMVRLEEKDRRSRWSHAASHQRVFRRSKTSGAFRFLNQAHRRSAKDFLSLSRWQRHRRPRSNAGTCPTTDRTLFARNAERIAG